MIVGIGVWFIYSLLQRTVVRVIYVYGRIAIIIIIGALIKGSYLHVNMHSMAPNNIITLVFGDLSFIHTCVLISCCTIPTQKCRVDVPPGGLPIACCHNPAHSYKYKSPRRYPFNTWVERSNRDKVSCPRTQPQWPRRDSNRQSLDHKSNALTTRPLHLSN